jgi:hypothetical protein
VWSVQSCPKIIIWVWCKYLVACIQQSINVSSFISIPCGYIWRWPSSALLCRVVW